MNNESFNSNHKNLEITEDTVWNCCPYQRYFARTQGEKVDDNWRLLVELKNNNFKDNNHHQFTDLSEIIKKIEEFNEKKNLEDDHVAHHDDSNGSVNFEFSRNRKPQAIPSMCLNNKSHNENIPKTSKKLPKLKVVIPKSWN
ncbi:hypothetical protein BVG19_g1212 [[Candida] boidinii]|nr:hypothetical protein BVG19_g1212 [[Candida] boidinii]OWB51163.1 hypothetical protein B5S27_g2722 [[Candida] boidinii]